eukprot:sb/3475615/
MSDMLFSFLIFSLLGSLLASRKLKDVLVTVEGYLESGVEFDSTKLPERGPLNFTLGTNTVIPGTCTNEGRMQLHARLTQFNNSSSLLSERRKLVIPSHLAYGNQGYRTIPVAPVAAYQLRAALT